MKQAVIGGGITAVILITIGLGYILMGGDSESGESTPTPTEAASPSGAAAPGEARDDRPSPPKTIPMSPRPVSRQLQVTKAEKPALEPDDPRVGLKDAEKWKAHRIQRNEKWRADQMKTANAWISENGVSQDQGREVLDILTRAHDILAGTRSDIEAGVISPSVGREEMTFAKEEVSIEVLNLLGEESGKDFLDTLAKTDGGGF
jgi:hypothetical protein